MVYGEGIEAYDDDDDIYYDHHRHDDNDEWSSGSIQLHVHIESIMDHCR